MSALLLYVVLVAFVAALLGAAVWARASRTRNAQLLTILTAVATTAWIFVVAIETLDWDDT